MNEKFGIEQVREYWTAQATEHQQSPAASWSDINVIEMEIREMLRWLVPGDRVLDVGCANGYSTLCYARERPITIRGLDYIPEMVAHANQALARQSGLRGTVEFAVGDILRLDEPSGVYDKLIVTRVLINLSGADAQRAALAECARVLKTGGLLLLSEATLAGWTRLNEFRAEWGLGPIPMPPFNRYIDHQQLAIEAASSLELQEIIDFASSYYVGTRVLKPLLAQVAGTSARVADPGMHWNRWMSALPAAGDYGTQKLLVFRRR